jgi:predicted amidohydrolase YtcJ
VPLLTSDEEDQMIVAGQKQRNALGITSTRDLSNWPPGMRAFVRMWRQGRLTVRVSMGLELPDAGDPAGLVRQQGVTPGFGDHWLRIDSAGEQPNPPGGNATPQQYKALMVELNLLGWQHAPHVATNEALEAVLQAYEAADRESPIRDKRWVVEHIPNVTPPLMERLAKLGVIVSTNMAGYAGNYDAAVRALGQEQAERQTPVREMLDHHLVIVIGSDYAQQCLRDLGREGEGLHRARKAGGFPGPFRGFHDHPGRRDPQAPSDGEPTLEDARCTRRRRQMALSKQATSSSQRAAMPAVGQERHRLRVHATSG